MAILKSAPEGSQVLDLNAARVARAEARAGKSNPVVKLAAGFVELSPEVDVIAAEELSAGHFRAGLGKLLVDPADIDVLLEGGLSKDDLESLVGFITGLNLGE
jgi:hypothetical protein